MNQRNRPQASSLRYMSGLDGLRAIAVLVVILYHLNTDWAPGGLLGVGIFFVLSGYLITDILISGWKTTGAFDLGEFWLRRARRLLPGMFTVLAAVLVWTEFTGMSIPSLKGDALASVFYVNNWWLIFHKVSYFESFGTPSPLGHLWSLAVEEQFYLVWPLVLAFVLRFPPRRGRLIGLALTAAAVSALLMGILFKPGADPSRIYYGTDTRAFGMLIGAALAMIWPSARLSTDRIRLTGKLALNGIGLAALASILVMVWNTDQFSESLYPGGLLLLSLLTAVLIAVLAHPASALGKLLGMKPLRWLGMRSYGIYLWHYPVIVLTTPAVRTEEPSLLRALLQVAATLGLAALSYKYIENPIRRGALSRLRKSLTHAAGRRIILRRTGYLFIGFTLFFSAAAQLFPSALASGMDSGTNKPAESVVSTVSSPSASPSPTSSAPTASPSAKPAGSGASTGAKPSSKPDRNSAGKGEGPASASGASEKPSASPAAGKPTGDDGKAGLPTASPTGTPTPSNPTGSPPPSPTAKPENPHPGENGEGITAIGDSVMLDAEPYFNELVPGIAVDGKIGRQMWDAQEIVDGLKDSGSLGQRVIFNLGTNGAFTKKQLEALLDSLAEVDQVLFVNVRVPRPWESNVNSMLSHVIPNYANATLVNWHEASAGHDEYFAKDGVHLNRSGAEAYAKLVISQFR